MRKTNYPQPLAQMERVEQSLISEKLDEMLDRIDKEDVGFVITEDGKDKYVLCPYRWFETTFDDDFGCVINSAIRNKLTGDKEDEEAVLQFLQNHYTTFDNRTLYVAMKDIDYHITSPLYDVGNKIEWKEIHALFSVELDKREANKQKPTDER